MTIDAFDGLLDVQALLDDPTVLDIHLHEDGRLRCQASGIWRLYRVVTPEAIAAIVDAVLAVSTPMRAFPGLPMPSGEFVLAGGVRGTMPSPNVGLRLALRMRSGRYTPLVDLSLN